ncbi:MAG: hypothetical protein M1292_01700, partial [Bacteroidetes bacterium]|nr:hypothetical protein [Bacteroidota bacterium]
MKKIFFCAIFMAGGSLMAQSFQPLESPRVPGNAYHLPVTGKADLQKALDAHRIVVLDNGDYTVPNNTVTLKSGYQLYGDPVGTSIPPVIVAPGTTGALLSTVTVKAGVTFPASPRITSGNVIERLIGHIT